MTTMFQARHLWIWCCSDSPLNIFPGYVAFYVSQMDTLYLLVGGSVLNVSKVTNRKIFSHDSRLSFSAVHRLRICPFAFHLLVLISLSGLKFTKACADNMSLHE